MRHQVLEVYGEVLKDKCNQRNPIMDRLLMIGHQWLDHDLDCHAEHTPRNHIYKFDIDDQEHDITCSSQFNSLMQHNINVSANNQTSIVQKCTIIYFHLVG